LVDGEPIAEPSQGIAADKITDVETIETVTGTGSLSPAEHNAPYAGSYWRDLVAFRDRGLEQSGIQAVFQRAAEPLQFFAVPQILYAGASFGTIIGG
jgi:hypothetical protein